MMETAMLREKKKAPNRDPERDGATWSWLVLENFLEGKLRVLPAGSGKKRRRERSSEIPRPIGKGDFFVHNTNNGPGALENLEGLNRGAQPQI